MRDLASAFADAYFRSSGDEAGGLLPFYVSYRAAVRGKVESVKFAEPEIPQAERDAALARARGLWLLSLAALERTSRRPALVLVGGLPGQRQEHPGGRTGQGGRFTVIRSDVVRKELAGVDRGRREPPPTSRRGSIRPLGPIARTPNACDVPRSCSWPVAGLSSMPASEMIEQRQSFLDAANRLGVAAMLLLCRAERRHNRRPPRARRGDASDADWTIYLRAAETWQEPGPTVRAALREINTAGSWQESLEIALAVLREVQLLDC